MIRNHAQPSKKFPKFHKFLAFEKKTDDNFVICIQFCTSRENFRPFRTIFSQFKQQRKYTKNTKLASGNTLSFFGKIKILNILVEDTGTSGTTWLTKELGLHNSLNTQNILRSSLNRTTPGRVTGFLYSWSTSDLFIEYWAIVLFSTPAAKRTCRKP